MAATENLEAQQSLNHLLYLLVGTLQCKITDLRFRELG